MSPTKKSKFGDAQPTPTPAHSSDTLTTRSVYALP